MLAIEGRLSIEISRSGGSDNRVEIRSSRPLRMASAFEGKAPESVLAQLPLLFGVCRTAQSSACARALRQALAIEQAATTDAAQAILVRVETAREHLLRVLVDWAGVLGEEPDVARMSIFRTMPDDVRRALFADRDAFSLRAAPCIDGGTLQAQIDRLEDGLAESVFAVSVPAWLGMSGKQALLDWCEGAGTVAGRLIRHVIEQGWSHLGATDGEFLPDFTGAELDDVMARDSADDFIARPAWRNRTFETTPLARHRDHDLVGTLHGEYGNGLLTRLVARLVELARTPGFVRDLLERADTADGANTDTDLEPGVGIAQVEAARGRLVHRTVVSKGTVRRYQILAPTEWNFHPDGVVARGLGRLREDDDDVLQDQAAMFIQAVDPCVAYELTVH